MYFSTDYSQIIFDTPKISIDNVDVFSDASKLFPDYPHFLADTGDMRDFIPEKEADLGPWLANLTTFAADHAGELKLPADVVAAVTHAAAAFRERYAEHLLAHNAAKAARQAKDSARRSAKSSARALVRRLQAEPSVTDAQRKGLGLAIPDRIRTPLAPPATAPLLSIHSDGAHRQRIEFLDEAMTRRGKPQGVFAAELWLALGEQPANVEPLPESMRLIGIATRSPHLVELPPGRRGQLARWRARWINRKGQPGPWSAVAEAVVG